MKQIKEKKPGRFMRTMYRLEALGNKIPHPVYLFLGLALFFAIISAICAAAGVSVTYDVAGPDGVLTPTTVEVVNMLSPKGIVGAIAGMWDNYKNLSILSLVLMVGIGMAVSEKTGFFEVLIRASVQKLPRWAIVYLFAVIGVCTNICGDAGPILATALGCMLYMSIGRNPWIGGLTGYIAAQAGYTANLIPSALDAGLSSITQQALNAVGMENYHVHMLSNYVFMVASTFVLAAIVAVVSETFLTKFLGDKHTEGSADALKSHALKPEERKGLRNAGICLLIIAVIVVASCIPANSPFRNAEGKFLPNSPLMDSIVAFCVIVFIALGTVYGIATKQIKKASDVPNLMVQGVVDLAPMATVFLFVSLMLYVFNGSNLAKVISVGGERFLRSIGLTGFPLLAVFIVVCAILNIIISSASAKWMILAPIFVPMLAALGVHPAVVQLAYRIGDSVTDAILPMCPALVATIDILNRYRDKELNKEEAGVGTILSSGVPFSLACLVGLLALFAIFYYCSIPVGVGM